MADTVYKSKGSAEATPDWRKKQEAAQESWCNKLSDMQKTEIVAAYVESGSYAEVARRFKCDRKNVSYLIKNNTELMAELIEAKDKNIMNVARHMQNRQQRACEIIDLILEGMGDKEKIKKANVRDLSISMGVIIDKFTADPTGDVAAKATHNALLAAITNMAEEIETEDNIADTKEVVSEENKLPEVSAEYQYISGVK